MKKIGRSSLCQLTEGIFFCRGSIRTKRSRVDDRVQGVVIHSDISIKRVRSVHELKRERHFISSFQHLRNQVRPFGTKLLSQLSGGCNYRFVALQRWPNQVGTRQMDLLVLLQRFAGGNTTHARQSKVVAGIDDTPRVEPVKSRWPLSVFDFCEGGVSYV